MSRSRAGTHSSAATAAASIDRPSSVFSSPVGDAAEPEHDEQVRRRHHRREPGQGDRVHEQAVDAHRERSDAPSASDERHEDAGAPARRARIGSGHDTSSCSTHAVDEIAAATTTPHAGHCSRARSCTDFAARQRGDVPDQPDHRVDGGDGQHRPSATRGRSLTSNPATTALAA